MMKRLSVALAALFAFMSAAFASGTIPLSMTQQFDSLGKPLSGGKLYLYQAGTTATPQNAFQDSALTIPWPNPITLDAAGRIPQLYLADGTIKIRLTDASGVTQVVADNLLVIGPSSGGGGGGGDVDATTVFATGDVKPRYGTGALSGWVRLNGRTIGSATSGATERANADAQALFEYLWGADSSLAVSGGRGATAAADWSANKTIALPDGRGRSLAALADMGATASTIFDGVTFTSGNATTLGSSLGASESAIAQANLPNVNFTVTIPAGQGSHQHNTNAPAIAITSINQTAADRTVIDYINATAIASPATLPAMSGTAASGGSGTDFVTISPFLLVTMYIKL